MFLFDNFFVKYRCKFERDCIENSCIENNVFKKINILSLMLYNYFP